jgi:DNA (cytosine-5)-methyltransferase 1
MKMTKIRYLSLFSGIEAFSCAVKNMPEYEPVAFAEIEPFPCAVLQHHYPDVPNLGDVTKIDGRKYRGLVNLIVGGSPCQGFSVAGYRKGLDDPRSGLAFAYVRLVDEVRAKWICWENVPGCFSTNGGQDLRSFFAAINDVGYSFAWTVLDSQHFGVAQRRRRLFLVGYLGTDWQRPAKVLFEPDSVPGDPPPRRAKRQGNTGGTQGDAGTCGGPRLAQNDVFATLCASGAGCDRPSAQGSQLDYLVRDIRCWPMAVQNAQRQNGAPAGGVGIGEENGPTFTVRADGGHPPSVAIAGGQEYIVRRITPVEAERLQGFPDNYTNIEFKGKPASDGLRYRALGNSMTVNVMEWIARRILMVEKGEL